ncbi:MULTISPECIES: BMC domain-containing protein [unclassified Romboutsia]|uniref:BMC domain-containing protein n=1 Tax=unclassified Romboutsia TaxID=2626894 RepID=UPI0008234EE0|nr:MULTISPECIES: BMC domain-containing protein [unclassified Romboutsia]SCI25739.1 Propanediol utilization protein PduU [uncultured Clostridium sp.]
MYEEKQRIIQESVPGKQISLAHIISNPKEDLYKKIGLIDKKCSMGILTITPSETVMVASNIAVESSNVSLEYVDRFSGSMIITGDFSYVEEAIKAILITLESTLNFDVTNITTT